MSCRIRRSCCRRRVRWARSCGDEVWLFRIREASEQARQRRNHLHRPRAPTRLGASTLRVTSRRVTGVSCYPLTLIDEYSRLLLRREGLLEPDGKQGPPFTSVGAGGLTKLSVWWLRLGVRVERIAPGKRQQNGRQERFHRTRKAETASHKSPISRMADLEVSDVADCTVAT